MYLGSRQTSWLFPILASPGGRPRCRCQSATKGRGRAPRDSRRWRFCGWRWRQGARGCARVQPYESGEASEACDAGEEWQQGDVAEGYAVAGGSQRLEDWNFDAQGFAEVLHQFGLSMCHDLDGGELPQAGEQHVVVRAGILHEDRSAFRIAQNCCGDLDADRCALLAWRRNFLRQVEGVGVAPTRNGALSAAGDLRRADDLSEFHERLVPVAGSLAGQKVSAVLFSCRQRRGARRSPRMAPRRARTRATLPSSTASGTSYAILRTAAAV